MSWGLRKQIEELEAENRALSVKLRTLDESRARAVEAARTALARVTFLENELNWQDCDCWDNHFIADVYEDTCGCKCHRTGDE